MVGLQGRHGGHPRLQRVPAARPPSHSAARSRHTVRRTMMAARQLRSKAKGVRPATVAAYLASLAPEKRAVIEEARALVRRHIPKGYAEFMNWGVINWGIPLEE